MSFEEEANSSGELVCLCGLVNGVPDEILDYRLNKYKERVKEVIEKLRATKTGCKFKDEEGDIHAEDLLKELDL